MSNSGYETSYESGSLNDPSIQFPRNERFIRALINKRNQDTKKNRAAKKIQNTWKKHLKRTKTQQETNKKKGRKRKTSKKKSKGATKSGNSN